METFPAIHQDDGLTDDRNSRTLVEIANAEFCNLSLANALTDNSGFAFITKNNGTILYSPIVG